MLVIAFINLHKADESISVSVAYEMRSDMRLPEPKLKRALCVLLSFFPSSRSASKWLTSAQRRVTFRRLGHFQTITKMWKSAGAACFDATAPTIEINEWTLFHRAAKRRPLDCTMRTSGSFCAIRDRKYHKNSWNDLNGQTERPTGVAVLRMIESQIAALGERWRRSARRRQRHTKTEWNRFNSNRSQSD